MTDIEKLLAIEDIKQLKARYCRAIDEKQLDKWHDIFTEDAVFFAPGVRNDPGARGVAAVIAFTKDVLADAITVHHLHAPEIAIVSDTDATGIWAMEDNIYWENDKPNFFGAKRHFRGCGQYVEKYRKENARWRISEMALLRFYTENDGNRTLT